MSNKTIILAAGGTGGHVFPAIALAHELITRGYNPVLLTDHRISKFSNALGDIPRHIIHAGKLSPTGLINIMRGLYEAFAYFMQNKPIAVVGFGGYPSFPGMAMGLLFHKPIVLHEQNSYMGKANKFFAYVSNAIGLSFPKTVAVPPAAKKLCKLVGNPVRPAIKKLFKQGYSPSDDVLYLLITGGSQGSSIFAEVVPQALAALPAHLKQKLVVTQQARAAEVDAVKGFYQKNNIKAQVATFIDDMHIHLSRADMVICRSGASTVAELAVAGRPAVLVPYPHATHNHQTTNARWLSDEQAAFLIPQPEFTPTVLTNLLSGVLQSPEKMANMAEAAKRLALPDAESALADLLEQHLKK